MSNSGRPLTITVSWRKVCAVLPALALIGGGIAQSAPVTPIHSIDGVEVANDSSAIVVPDTALTLPGPARILPDNLPVAIPEALGTGLGTPALGGSSSTALSGTGSTSLSGTGIPVRALEAYRRAATLTNQADPGCHIDWALIAAIGRVESDHARFGGNQLDPAGIAQPGIIGIALDGSNGTARITDSDSGTLDQDNLFDRAVGPMQFIPTTWQVAGVDANGDGVKNPQDITDAASATAVYLCSGPGDLTNPADLHAAILRYNHSDSYVQLVTGIAASYRLGVSALPATNASFAAAANPITSTSRQPGPVLTTMLGRSPSTTVAAPAPTTKVAAATAPTTTAPTTTAPTTTAPTTTAPTTTAPTKAAPAATVRPTTAPATTAPTTTVPAQVPATTVPVAATTTVPATTVPAQLPTETVPAAVAPTTTAPAAPAPVPAPATTVPATTVPCVPLPTPAAPAATPVSCVPLPCGAIADPNAPAPTEPCPTATGVAAP